MSVVFLAKRGLRTAAAASCVSIAAIALSSRSAAAQDHANHANWELAEKFSSQNLRSRVYTSAVNPHWLGQSDSLCYDWKDHSGSTFFLVVPTTKTKRPLFDQSKLAAQLSEQSHHAHDPQNLPFTSITFSKDRKTFTFTADSSRWEWDVATEALKRLGPAGGPGAAGAAGRGGRGGRGGGDGTPATPPDTVNTCGGAAGGRAGGGGGGGGGLGGRGGGDFHNYSPDSSMFAFARDHNLYVVKVATKDTVQLTHDGVKDYSFGARDTVQERQQQELNLQQQQQDSLQGAQQGGRGGGVSRDPRVRANVTWSPDSKAFAVSRMDNRKVGKLYLVNNLAPPRPELMTYTYAMPGEANVGQEELWVCKAGDTEAHAGEHQEVEGRTPVRRPLGRHRFRPSAHGAARSYAAALRAASTSRCRRRPTTQLLQEDIENNSSERQNVRYVKAGGDFIWWSERSGWGHYYLYDNAGHLKHALTSGAWRAERIVELDSIKGVMYFTAVGKDPTENPYYSHLYKVNLDGTGLALLDAGDADHDSRLSPNKRWIVDNSSRIDMVPTAVLRDAAGKVVMNLETMDVSRLKELGLEAAGDLPHEGRGRRDGHLRQHVEAVRLRLDEEVSDHRQRVSGSADRVGELHVLADRGAAAARPARLHRHPDRQPRRQPAALAGVPGLRLLQPARLRPRRQERRGSSSWPRRTSGSTSTASASTATRAAASSPPRRCCFRHTTSSSRSA